MSPPFVNDVARFASPTGSGVLPRTLPSVILPVGLAAVTFAIVAVGLNGADSAAILLHDAVGMVVGVVVGMPGVMPVSVVRNRSIQFWTSCLSALLIFSAWYRVRSPLQRSRTLCFRLTRYAAW